MASLIETFIYKFIGDTEDYDKANKRVQAGQKQAEQAGTRTEKNNKLVKDSFGKLATAAIAAGAALLSYSAIKGVAEASAEQTAALADTARQLRMNADDLDVWQRANEAAGGSAEQMAATFKMLTERTRDPIRALEQVADRFKGLSDFQADTLGQQLGIDAGTVQMMRQGKDGLVALIREQQKLGQVTAEQTAAAKEWRLQTKLTGFALDDVKRQLMVAVIPGVSSFLKAMRGVIGYVSEHKTFFISFFALAGGAIALYFTPAIISATTALIRMGAAALMNPFGLLVAGVVALITFIALLIDDFIAFKNGADSVIGDLVKKFPWLGEAIKSIEAFVSSLADAFGVAFDFIVKAISSPQTAIDTIAGLLADLTNWLSGKFPTATKLAVAAIDGIAAAFDAVVKGIKWILEKGTAVGAVIGAVKGFFGGGSKDQPATPATAAAGAGQAAMAATAHPLASTSSAAISNSTMQRNSSKNTNVTTGPITVVTQATDAEGVSRALGNTLSAHTQQSVAEFDDGIAA